MKTGKTKEQKRRQDRGRTKPDQKTKNKEQ